MVNISFQKINSQIQYFSDRVNNGGYDKNIYQSLDKSQMDESKATNNQFISANTSIAQNSKEGSKILESIDKDLDRFRELTLMFSDGAIKDRSVVSAELTSIRDTIESKLNSKNDQGYIFAGTSRNTKPFDSGNFNGNLNDTFLITSSGHRAVKLLGPTFAMTPNGNILNDLDSLITNLGDPSNLDKIDSLKGNISTGITKYGLNESSANSQISYLKELNISTEALFENKYKHMEKYIADLNNSILQYQAMASVMKKTEGLSLVNYL